MNIYNPKMEKRLSWINMNNQDQAQWIEQFINSKARMLYPYLVFPQPNTLYDPNYMSAFIYEAKNWPESSENREFCRRLKAAWIMRTKRKNNKMVEGSYTISTTARKILESISRKNNQSLSKIIEVLITNTDDIRKRESKIIEEFYKELKYKELISIQNKLEATEKERDFTKQELMAVKRSLKVKEHELKSVQQKLEATEKKLNLFVKNDNRVQSRHESESKSNCLKIAEKLNLKYKK